MTLLGRFTQTLMVHTHTYTPALSQCGGKLINSALINQLPAESSWCCSLGFDFLPLLLLLEMDWLSSGVNLRSSNNNSLFLGLYGLPEKRVCTLFPSKWVKFYFRFWICGSAGGKRASCFSATLLPNDPKCSVIPPSSDTVHTKHTTKMTANDADDEENLFNYSSV